MIDLQSIASRLAGTDVQDEQAVVDTINDLKTRVEALEAEPVVSEGPDFLVGQIGKLKAAAEIPARNYARIYGILKGLHQAAEISKRPQYASIRPRLSSITEKVAGLFAEVDTVEDLDRPLEEIERAVLSLYGDQSKNDFAYFERKNKPNRPVPTK